MEGVCLLISITNNTNGQIQYESIRVIRLFLPFVICFLTVKHLCFFNKAVLYLPFYASNCQT